MDEAVADSKRASDYELLQLVALFEQYNQAPLGEQLIRDRTKVSNDQRLKEWIKAPAVARGDWAEALAIAEEAF